MGIDEIIAKLRREAAGRLRREQQIAEEQREAQEFGTELGESTLRFMRGPRHELYEPATETDVAATERAIGLALPAAEDAPAIAPRLDAVVLPAFRPGLAQGTRRAARG